MSKTYAEQIGEIAHKLPIEVWDDIKSRAGDWMLSGGNANDPYIAQQLQYAKDVINTMNRGLVK